MTSILLRKVENSLQQIFTPTADDEAVILPVPVQYPSGSLASLEITGGADTAWISDRGLGYLEAEMMGADASYSRIARHEAEARGVSFDGRAIFALKLPLDQLAAGIVAVANASVFAAAETIRFEQDKKVHESNQRIFERVQRAFPDADVTLQMEIDGGRSSWTVHNVVQLPGRTGIFEPTTQHQASISAKFLMFSDLSSRQSLSLNAVMRDPKNLDAKGQMLRDVANIIAIDDPISAYQMSVS